MLARNIWILEGGYTVLIGVKKKVKSVLIRLNRRVEEFLDPRRKWRFFWSAVVAGVVLGLVFAGALGVLEKMLNGEEQPQVESANIEELAAGSAAGQEKDEFGAFDSLIMEDGSIFLAGDNRKPGAAD